MIKKRIGITGGICSGKTTICKMIEELGYRVFYSDFHAINLANNSTELKKELINAFGKDAYLSDDTYNRKYMSSIVFKDKDKLNIVNDIFSRYIEKSFNDFCYSHKDEEIIFNESALIFEHNKQDSFDDIICVYANKDIVIERLKSRNGFTDEQIKDRLNSQMDVELKKSKSDYIIDNSYSVSVEQLKEIINKIMI